MCAANKQGTIQAAGAARAVQRCQRNCLCRLVLDESKRNGAQGEIGAHRIEAMQAREEAAISSMGAKVPDDSLGAQRQVLFGEAVGGRGSGSARLLAQEADEVVRARRRGLSAAVETFNAPR